MGLLVCARVAALDGWPASLLGGGCDPSECSKLALTRAADGPQSRGEGRLKLRPGPSQRSSAPASGGQ